MPLQQHPAPPWLSCLFLPFSSPSFLLPQVFTIQSKNILKPKDLRFSQDSCASFPCAENTVNKLSEFKGRLTDCGEGNWHKQRASLSDEELTLAKAELIASEAKIIDLRRDQVITKSWTFQLGWFHPWGWNPETPAARKFWLSSLANGTWKPSKSKADGSIRKVNQTRQRSCRASLDMHQPKPCRNLPALGAHSSPGGFQPWLQ